MTKKNRSKLSSFLLGSVAVAGSVTKHVASEATKEVLVGPKKKKRKSVKKTTGDGFWSIFTG